MASNISLRAQALRCLDLASEIDDVEEKRLFLGWAVALQREACLDAAPALAAIEAEWDLAWES